MNITIINGPNLNLLGTRDPEIYGSETFGQTFLKICQEFADHEINYLQSNSEGEIIDFIQQANHEGTDGIILNPGAYAHYSYAIADAVADSVAPVIEVHISNIHGRESFRATSVTAAKAQAVIAGCGRYGYSLAINYLIKTKSEKRSV